VRYEIPNRELTAGDWRRLMDQLLADAPPELDRKTIMAWLQPRAQELMGQVDEAERRRAGLPPKRSTTTDPRTTLAEPSSN
jgi:hypothetical protein